MSMIENFPDTLRNQLRAEVDDLADTPAVPPASLRAPFIAAKRTDSEGGSASVVSSIGGEDWADAVHRSSQTTAVDTVRSYQQQQSARRPGKIAARAVETVTWGGLTASSKKRVSTDLLDPSTRRHLSEIDQNEIRRRHSHASQHVHTRSTETSTRQEDEVLTSSTAISRQRHHKRHGEVSAGSQNVSNRGNGKAGGSGDNWTSFGTSSLSSTPIDQLIAAILDGDVQGIRSVVRSRGDSLHSEFWAEIAHTVLPLHRAISGLHFHGNHKTLVQTLETLVQLGADVSAHDHTGNSLLHKVK